MAIYRLPPSPFVGGRQPLDNRDLNPSIEAVEVNEPISRQAPAILTAILIAWQPLSPNLQAQRFVPQVAAEEKVSYTSQVNTILISWYPVFTLPQRAPNTPQEAAAEERVPYTRSWLPGVLLSWEPTSILIQVPPYLPSQGQETFVSPGHPQLYVYTVELPLPQAPKKIAALIEAAPAPVNDPPFSSRNFKIINEWYLPPYIPTQIYSNFISETAVVADNPPFGQRIWLNTIVRMWEPPPPLPIIPQKSFFTPTFDGIIIWLWKRTV